MSEKLNKGSWKTRAGRLLATAAEGLLAPSKGKITDATYEKKPDNPADIFRNGPEIASLPLSPDERIRAIRVLESDLEKATEAFKVKAESRKMYAGCRLDDRDTMDDMEETKYALVQLGDMYAGKEMPGQEKGEPIDLFLNAMILEHTHLVWRDPRYRGEEIHTRSQGLLYRYARMREIHKALIENPASARANIFGEQVPIVGVADPFYREVMLLRTMTLGWVADVICPEPRSA